VLLLVIFVDFGSQKGHTPFEKWLQKLIKNQQQIMKKHLQKNIKKNDAEKGEKKQKTRQTGRPDTMKSLIKPG